MDGHRCVRMCIYIYIYICVYVYACIIVYVHVWACVCTCIGWLRITSKQLRTNLPGIAATLHEALPAWAGVIEEGNSGSKPPLDGHWLAMGDEPPWCMA